MKQNSSNLDLEEEAFYDLEDLEPSTTFLPEHLGEQEFQSQVDEFIAELQTMNPYSPQAAALCEKFACFGDAHFMFNKRGHLCFLINSNTEINPIPR